MLTEQPIGPEQAEMPFAVVQGAPLLQMPRDLYIPPDALEVFLEAFEGPLDLLLYLIKRQNLDILDIPIAEITRQYMKYVELMTDMQLELAAEYLVMAAMLAEIKSRMLLPRPVEADDEEDPRAELVRRLQEYERYKQAAEDIDALERLGRDVHIAQIDFTASSVARAVPEVSLQDMLSAFRDVLAHAEKYAHHQVEAEPLSLRQRMSEVLAAVQSGEFRAFVTLFDPKEGRTGIVITFLALLELIRESLIEIVQAEPYAPIHVRAASEPAIEQMQDQPAEEENNE